MATGTIPTQVRLTAADKARIEAIRVRFGLPSLAAAIRYAVETTYRGIDLNPAPEKSRRKSRAGA